MRKYGIILFMLSVCIFYIDQHLKALFLNGLRWQSEYIDLVLTFNKGIAFSMFAFLGEYLKYIQGAILLGFACYIFWDKNLLKNHYQAFGIIFGAGASNVYDRFIHDGVVDYVFWHKWFEFAVFNFADVMIDLGIVLVLLQSFFCKEKT